MIHQRGSQFTRRLNMILMTSTNMVKLKWNERYLERYKNLETLRLETIRVDTLTNSMSRKQVSIVHTPSFDVLKMNSIEENQKISPSIFGVNKFGISYRNHSNYIGDKLTMSWEDCAIASSSCERNDWDLCARRLCRFLGLWILILGVDSHKYPFVCTRHPSSASSLLKLLSS